MSNGPRQLRFDRQHGSVVGLALVSVVAASAVLNAFADRFARWASGPPAADPDAPRSPTPDGPPAQDAPRLRREAFGGLLAWSSPPAILFVNEAAADAAEAAGAHVVGGGPAPDGSLSAPIEVHVAVTNRCPVACDGCYLDAGPDQPVLEPTTDDLEADLATLAKMGVLEIALGGGEALLRDQVIALPSTCATWAWCPTSPPQASASPMHAHRSLPRWSARSMAPDSR